MKREQTEAVLGGMVQIVALLNFYKEMSGDIAHRILNSKSSRRKTKMTQEMTLAQMGITTLISAMNLMAPFLVSLGVNLGETEDGDYVLMYKGNVVELTDLGREKFLANLMREMEAKNGLQESDAD